MPVIAHLSDIHLPLRQAPAAAELLGKRGLSYLSWQRRRRLVHTDAARQSLMADLRGQHPDIVAVTGDLTNLGTRAEFAVAADWMTRLPGLAMAVPGNHDALVDGLWPRVASHWSSWMPDDPAGWPFMRQRDGLALIGLTTAVPSLPFLATGALGGGQIERLRGMLRQARAQGDCRVVLMHHVPLDGVVARHKGLGDAAAFRAAIADEGAELILFGHAHRTIRAEVAGVPALGVASASHVVGPATPPDQAACWQRIEVSPYPGGWRLRVEQHALRADGSVQPAGEFVIDRPAAVGAALPVAALPDAAVSVSVTH